MKVKHYHPDLFMEQFTNNTININDLPRFETVEFEKLQRDYWKVLVVNSIVGYLILALAIGVATYFIEEIQPLISFIWGGFALILVFSVVVSRIGFLKKGFAFREHDVLFRDGIIATNTTIIPYNRVQHVALHEGWLSRYFGLAKVEIFTAGGSSSDIEIPGIEKEQAEKIKQLLMGKMQHQL